MIDRRRFIGTAIVGGAGAVVAGAGCAPRDATPGRASASGGSPAIPDFELDEVTVDELQRSMESGQRTARSITELYLGRIEALDRQGPELGALTIGTETGGSIMCPSSSNGIVGIKPTVGLWSRSGIIPISHSQDTAGPMCRTVRDAAILLGACPGVDPRDAATTASQGNARTDYTESLDPAGLKGARIGVARSFTGFDPRVEALFEEAVEAMRAEGAVIIDPANLDAAAWNDPLSLVLLEYEFKADLNAYFADLGPEAPVRSLADVIEFNERNADREMPYFGQERMIASQARGPLTDAAYLEAKATIQRANRADGIDRVVAEHRLDAIVAPTRDLPWPTDHIKGDRLDGGSSAGPAAIAGYPDITVPMGFVHGLPAGISFFGSAWSEPTLLRIAYAYEQTTQHRQAPTFAATLG